MAQSRRLLCQYVLRSAAVLVTCATWTSLIDVASAAEPALPIIDKVELQPLQAQARRVATALEGAGAPLTAEQQQALDKALEGARDPRQRKERSPSGV